MSVRSTSTTRTFRRASRPLRVTTMPSVANRWWTVHLESDSPDDCVESGSPPPARRCPDKRVFAPPSGESLHSSRGDSSSRTAAIMARIAGFAFTGMRRDEGLSRVHPRKSWSAKPCPIASRGVAVTSSMVTPVTRIHPGASGAYAAKLGPAPSTTMVNVGFSTR